MANDDKAFPWPSTLVNDDTTISGLVDCCFDTLTCLMEGVISPDKAMEQLKSDLLKIKALSN